MRSNIVGAVMVFSAVLWLVMGIALHVHDERKLRMLQRDAVEKIVDNDASSTQA